MVPSAKEEAKILKNMHKDYLEQVNDPCY